MAKNVQDEFGVLESQLLQCPAAVVLKRMNC